MTITEPTFVARILLNRHTDTEESLANADAFVDLPDGSSWALTIFAVDEVRRLLASYKKTGEVANGSYFWAVDQLIVPEPGVSAMSDPRTGSQRGDKGVGVRCGIWTEAAWAYPRGVMARRMQGTGGGKSGCRAGAVGTVDGWTAYRSIA
ncbi:hypothetical protein [Micromonospora sp. NPDC023888]|uniref:hypothetical protein n=1 Tax=Micromonospora sp. NPDC023888 TaxID=3155607 RepID=UPI0033DC241E